MLAIISDLHFCDGTATDRNVDPKAFALALSDLYETASNLATTTQADTRLDLVLLGDVFDFLRTERWFETREGVAVPVADRPWGSARALEDGTDQTATIIHANAILDEILTENVDALATLRGELCAPPNNVQVRRIYFPGNHDRLCLLDAKLHARCRTALAAVDETTLSAEGIYAHHLEMKSYGLLARHGHEWDDWNFERYTGAPPSHYTDADYLVTPIGDAITTELAARLPHELAKNLSSSSLDAAEQAAVVARMQRIEDVRPLLASFHWAHYEATRIHQSLSDTKKKKELADALNSTVRTLATDFRNLDYFHAWRKRHHRLLHLDSAAELELVLDALTVINIDTVGAVAGAVERFIGRSGARDTCRAGAALEDLHSVGTAGLRFVVYGHTHDPLQVALRANAADDIYLNSGTFRSTVFRTDDMRGFIGWDRMTYLSFLTEEEMSALSRTKHAGPGFNSWTGNRNR
jgi:UDP-2,3-diacylglucosamine pyrophosphatase LpxH